MKTVRQLAYDHIRAKLESGVYTAGQRVSEQGLSKELGVSTIPVREALSQLISEGLVRKAPGLGSFVPELTRDEAVELFDIRLLLECYATGRAAERITSSQVAELQACIKQQQEMTRYLLEQDSVSRDSIFLDDEMMWKWSKIERDFHMILLDAAESPRVVKLVTDLQLMTLVFCGWHVGETLRRAGLAETLLRHYRIMCAVRRGDSKGAQDAMRQHITHALKTGLERFDRLTARLNNRHGSHLAKARASTV